MISIIVVDPLGGVSAIDRTANNSVEPHAHPACTQYYDLYTKLFTLFPYSLFKFVMFITIYYDIYAINCISSIHFTSSIYI